MGLDTTASQLFLDAGFETLVMNTAFFTSFFTFLLNTYYPSSFLSSSYLTNQIMLVLSISPAYFVSDLQEKQTQSIKV